MRVKLPDSTTRIRSLKPENTPKYALVRTALPAALALAATLFGACATPQVAPIAQVSTAAADRHIDQRFGALACRDALAEPPAMAGRGLDPVAIRLTSWNMHKKSAPGWQADLDRLSSNTDLVLLQEASLREETITGLDASRHWSFAPGYRRGENISGVMTMAAVPALTHCSLVTWEPLLRTPKATNITRYRLEGRDETLVVVNVHAVNFSLGLGAFKQQFEAIRVALENHEGPIVLSGDLNTWREGRVDIVNELAEELGLVALSFGEDHRVSRFGRRLDHLFVRDVKALSAGTMPVTTSDHNPMSATLSL